jgi:hypothetical protein
MKPWSRSAIHVAVGMPKPAPRSLRGSGLFSNTLGSKPARDAAIAVVQPAIDPPTIPIRSPFIAGIWLDLLQQSNSRLESKAVGRCCAVQRRRSAAPESGGLFAYAKRMTLFGVRCICLVRRHLGVVSSTALGHGRYPGSRIMRLSRQASSRTHHRLVPTALPFDRQHQ